MLNFFKNIFFELYNFNKLSLIRSYCLSYKVDNYTIHKDLSVDIISSYGFINVDFNKIPFKINEFKGNIICREDMVDFSNFPKIVMGDIYCTKNWNIRSLIGSPLEIHGNFVINNCAITSLIGSPLEIHGDFILNNNYINDLENGPRIIKGDMNINHNEISSLKGLNNTIIFGHLKYLENRMLPNEIRKYPSFSQVIVKEFDNYGLWNSDNSFNEKRFNILFDDMQKGMYDDIIFKH